MLRAYRMTPQEEEHGFQSSPGPKAGCYRNPCIVSVGMTAKFQSSPGPKAGCYAGLASNSQAIACFNPPPARKPDATTTGTQRGSYSSFNPHPARKPDATRQSSRASYSQQSFNPHPARKPDATIK